MKEFLSQKGMSFEERDASRDKATAWELLTRTGQSRVPVTVIDGRAIIGFDPVRLEQVLSQMQQSPCSRFGAMITDAAKTTAKRGSQALFGAHIDGVKSGSVAARIGLAQGDIITELNTQRVTSATDLEYALSKLNKGSRFTLVFVRDSKTFSIEGVF